MTDVPMIAIVDDDEAVRTSTASFVRSLGYATRTYRSGTEFLSESSRREPDCMIADVQMPGISGPELQQRLIAEGRRFPIIFLTAFPSEAIRGRVMAAGAAGFLAKPSDGETIVARIEDALARRAAR
ncbi:response regulator transcription factor [Hansschlegelia zhihuaiae]|uniref:Response regulator n=1 Tax=Hansschlegelia zhihuaiae TaxID=405005 RepID=A0A4Q0MGS1_9HYPH|nr:response regulator [Hansschlegelia zhihuaiae]RXF72680.1 response regulator [Hansschlegelia zhihuaiae]